MRSIIHHLHPVAAAVIALTLSAPAGAALQPGAMLSFTPGTGAQPAVKSERFEFKAGQSFRTGADEIRELLLPDGTSITIAPNSELTLESIDQESGGRGALLLLKVVRGLVRVAGGPANDAQPIVVQTPVERITLSSASAVIEVGADGRTRAGLTVGREITMSRSAPNQAVQRPGFELVATDGQGAPSGPARQEEKALLGDALLLGTQQLAGRPAAGDVTLALASGDSSSATANRFASAAENQPQAAAPAPPPPPPPPAAPFVDLSGSTTVASSNAGFGPGGSVAPPILSPAQPSEVNGDSRNLAQVRGNATGLDATFVEPTRQYNKTTSRLYNSGDSYSELVGNGLPRTLLDRNVGQPDASLLRLQYVFRNDGGGRTGPIGLQLDAMGSDLGPGTHVLGGFNSFDASAPLIINNIQTNGRWPASGRMGPSFTVIDDEVPNQPGEGHMFQEVAQVSILQAGFTLPTSGNVMTRAQDNFLLLQVSPGKVDRRVRDQLRENFSLQSGNLVDPIGFVNELSQLQSAPRFVGFFGSTSEVNTVAKTVLDTLATITVTNADRGTGSYLTTIAPLLTALADLGAANGGALATPAQELAGAFRFGFADITAMRALTISGAGAVNDPIAFLVATGRTTFGYTLAQLNAFARVALGAGVAPGQALAASEITGADFIATLAQINTVLGGSGDPSRSERYLFATGNVDAGRINADGSVNTSFTNRFAIDRFFVSAGLENFADKDVAGTTVARNIRAFLRQDTALGLPLADSGVIVVNTGSSAAAAQNAFLHADFGFSGTGAAQRSTLSTTIGQVRYELRTQADLDIKNTYDVVVDARTVGSSHSATTGTVAITSPLTSTAAGGGNPAAPRDGYAGYLLLENYTPDDTSVYSGGVEHALGSAASTDQRYAVMRLASATGQITPGARTSQTLNGWVGGMVEREGSSGSSLDVTSIGSGTVPGNLSIVTDAGTNRVQADLALTGRAGITLGGTAASSPPSAFVDDQRFAAGSTRAALVSADVLRDAAGALPTALQSVPTYSHLQWGFFFGDIPRDATGVALDHLHLGTWIAGRAADPSQLPSTGSATYTGHAIGNVATGGALYTSVGTYQNSWNFAQRAGTMNMSFDAAQYVGNTHLRDASVVFEGTFTGTGVNRGGGVVGNFVRSAAGDGGAAPAALAGRFVISETAGGTPYRASGTFGAEKRP